MEKLSFKTLNDCYAVVILPHGVLFRGGAEEAIRTYIVKNLNYLDAVIGLAPNCFYGTSIPVSLLVLKNDREQNKDNILFIEAATLNRSFLPKNMQKQNRKKKKPFTISLIRQFPIL